MDHLIETEVLKFNPDTLEAVRKDVNLDKPGRMSEAVDILENWVKLQPHFNKKDFCREYLELTLITTKGLVERAKERIDKLCTFKTLMPEFFTVPDVKKEFIPLRETILDGHVPHLTPQHYRVFISKIISDETLNSTTMFTFYKYLIMRSEYLKRYEYCAGFVIILDFNEVNVLNALLKINPLEVRQVMTLMTEGYGTRIKGIHVLTASKAVDAIVALVKQVFSDKLANRIHTHKTSETIYEFVPKEIMPVDYGGNGKSLKDIHDDWMEVLSRKAFLDYFEDMTKANTNESIRLGNKFNENYIGMPGSFRAMTVD